MKRKEQIKDICSTEEQWDFVTKNGFGEGGGGTNKRPFPHFKSRRMTAQLTETKELVKGILFRVRLVFLVLV